MARRERDTIGRIWVPDPVIAARRWLPPEPPLRPPPFHHPPHRASGARVSPDGHTITFEFVGAPSDLLDYRLAEVAETQTAIAIVPITTYREEIEPVRVVSAVGSIRTVTVELHEPLEARILVDIDGSPIAVIAAD